MLQFLHRFDSSRSRASRALAVVCAVFVLSGESLGQLRVVNYNIAQLMGNDEALKEVFAAVHADDKPGFAVPVSVFLFQEVQAADVAALQQLLNQSAPPGVLYAPGTYVNNNEDNFGGAQAMFYRAGMILEDSSQFDNFFTGAGRFTSRWRLRVLGYDSTLAGFFAYSSHLKASNSQQDAELRLFGVQQIRNNAHALGPNLYIIYSGDFNFHHHQEPGYLWWFNPTQFNAAVDPLGTGSWAGPDPANAIKHTQSPLKFFSGGLIGGGLDDRFDFQLTTVRFGDGKGLSRIPDTYRAFGNDGLKYNEAINFGDNFYYPDDVPRSNTLADALHDASDHIPVVVDYQLPARMAANASPMNFGTVIAGAEVQINWSVVNNVNTAHVVTPIGAEVLHFTATGGGAISGVESGSVAALNPPATGAMTLNTNGVAPGAVSGSITFTSPNEAVQPPQIVRTINGTVIAPSQPSLSSADVVESLTIELDFDPDTGDQIIAVPVYNVALNDDSAQAAMNVIGVSGLSEGDALVFLPPPPEVIDIAPGESQTLLFVYDTTLDAPGVYTFDLTIHATDEDLPGASATNLSLKVEVRLGDAAQCPGDLTGSGNVGVPDLLQLLSCWGPVVQGCEEADLTNSGSVGVPDLLDLLSQWGPCPR